LTALPGGVGGTELVAWRLDREKHASTWDSGEGAFQVGGRWNSTGVGAAYCALDPATPILEVAAHKDFDLLDTELHTIAWLQIDAGPTIHVVNPATVSNRNWLKPGVPGAGQQAFGDKLVAGHAFEAIPASSQATAGPLRSSLRERLGSIASSTKNALRWTLD
jgi:RES domain-containing protein